MKGEAINIVESGVIVSSSSFKKATANLILTLSLKHENENYSDSWVFAKNKSIKMRVHNWILNVMK